MKTAILIHGWSEKEQYFDPSEPAPSNAHWFPWVQRQLLLKGILAQTPEMPGEYSPHYGQWKKMFERFEINKETILIGHSCGGGFLVRWLSENDVNVGKVLLVAPWLDPKKEIDPEFFNFSIDPHIVKKTKGLSIFYSTNDMETVNQSIEILKSTLLGVKFKEFHDKGHFVLGDMKTEQFPELIGEIL